MKEHQDNAAEDTGNEDMEPVNRLCNEIQLFDLCELDRCSHKSGRFCTNRELIDRFERIADIEDRRSVSEELADGDDDGDDDDVFGDGFDDEDYGDDAEDRDQY